MTDSTNLSEDSLKTPGASDHNLNLPQFNGNISNESDPEMDQNDLDSESKEQLETAPLELSAVYNIPVQVSAVLGRTTMQVSQLLKLGRGAVIELDRKVGEAVDVYVNNRLVARGEVVVVDEHLGITMTEIIKTDRPYQA